MRPNYTIFLPLYDADLHLENICTNIKNQKIKPDQVIVIDDTKNSSFFIKKLTKFLSCKNNTNEFVIVKNKENLKPGLSWNRNIHLIKNYIVFRLDADDIWSPYHTEKMIEEYLSDKSHTIYAQKAEKIFFKKIFYNYDFIFTNQINHSSILINMRQDKIFYPATEYPYDDLFLFIKLKYFKKKSIKFVDIDTCKIDLSSNNRWSNRSFDKKKTSFLRKLFLVALKRRLAIKKITYLNLFKIFTKYDLFKSVYIFYKMCKF